ncbi:MAG: serine/threonine-protein kinase [Myxococcota bacterium]|jgi:serine/threonine-protein kinase|nr:serine/threonine-protein kinase [Myxococcota bacterium]
MRELQAGQRVGRHYLVSGPLAQGGFAKLYSAQDSRDGREVVLKLLAGEMLRSDEGYRRFEHEAAVMQLLEHENIVSTLDFGRDEDGTPFLVIERLHGQTLDALIDAGPQPTERVQAIVEGVLCALEAVHGQGVVHRDLKPANVFLCPEADGRERVKLIDFGLAKVVEFGGKLPPRSFTIDGMVVGTPGYIAPELLAGGELSVQADLYVLGVIACELLNGAPGYATRPPKRLQSQASGEPRVPPSVRKTHFGTVLQGLIAREPLRRFVSAREALEALRTGSDGDALLPEPERFRKRAGMLGALFILVVLLCWWWLLAP